jgi:hypothetical protein
MALINATITWGKVPKNMDKNQTVRQSNQCTIEAYLELSQ